MFVITGGGSGIGQSLAYALVARNCSVLIIGRRESALVQTAAFSPLIHYFVADLSTEEGCKTVVEHLNQHDSIQGLIHNAGSIEPIAPIAAINTLAWQKNLATNLMAPLFLTQLLLNRLKKGRVLHIGSGAAYFPIKGWSAYCVSKAALSMLTRCWQLECEDTAFASVMPGIVDTDMQALIRDAQCMDETKHDFFNTLYQNRLLLSPETVALFLCWLLLDLDHDQFISKEWDIYDKQHHAHWLVAPHQVPSWEED